MDFPSSSVQPAMTRDLDPGMRHSLAPHRALHEVLFGALRSIVENAAEPLLSFSLVPAGFLRHTSRHRHPTLL